MLFHTNSKLGEGTELAPWSVVAKNNAVDSRNPIHNDEIARRMGFKAGLVPGITVFGYMTHPLVKTLGRGFLENGRIEIRLRQPVYEGDRITISSEITQRNSDSVSISVKARNSSKKVCAIASATCDSKRSPHGENVPSISHLPTVSSPINPDTLSKGQLLGTLESSFDPVHIDDYLKELNEDLDLYRNHVVHPAWLLHHANLAIEKNLILGPWMHVSSEVELLGTIAPGESFSVWSRVQDLYTRKGHEYIDVDVVLITTRQIMRVKHSAIYRIARAGSQP